MPLNTQANIHAKTQPGRKIEKSRFSVLFGANADRSHKLKPVVVGHSARPRVLKDCLKNFLVITIHPVRHGSPLTFLLLFLSMLLFQALSIITCMNCS